MSEVSHGGGGRAFALLLAYGALVAVALSASPLTAVHGVESALALGILSHVVKPGELDAKVAEVSGKRFDYMRDRPKNK